MVCKIPARRFFPDTDFDAQKILRPGHRNDIFDAVVPACTSFLADAQISRRKADVIIDHDHLFFRVHLVITEQFCHTLPA